MFQRLRSRFRRGASSAAAPSARPENDGPSLAALSDPHRPIPDAARLPVVLIHGLYTGPMIFLRLARALREDKRKVFYFSYASRWRDIPENAARLAHWFAKRGPGPFDVVTYSMGGVILRWAADHHDLPRLRRVVMIGPPNRGACIADLLHRRMGPLFPLIYGQGAMQLRRGARGLAEGAGRPAAEIGVIAGGTGRPRGFNPWIPGDNDQTVAVEETILEGMKDFSLIHCRHTLLTFSPETIELTLRFLRTGLFRPPSLEAALEADARRH